MSSFLVFIIIMIGVFISAAKKQERQEAQRKRGKRPVENAATYQKKPQQTPDILQRAMKNVKNATTHQYHNPADDEKNCETVGAIFDEDQSVSEISPSVDLQSDKVDISWADGTALMDEVQNLIVCGYDGHLEFGRDAWKHGCQIEQERGKRMPQGKPAAGERYLHFKNKKYQILAVATHSETREKMVVYQALYGDYGVYVRPYDMFVSEVDHLKYPEVTQKYRFEFQGYIGDPIGNLTDNGTAETETEEETANPVLLQFLDAETYAEKYDVLKDIGNAITDRLIDDLSASLDLVIPEGDVDTRYVQLNMQ